MEPFTQPYSLEKRVWDETDFERMGWHDCRIHAIAFGAEQTDHGTADVLFDIDYIFEWVHAPSRQFSFWVTPCTLVFRGARDLRISIQDTMGYALGPFEIAELDIAEKLAWGYRWRIDLQVGDITLNSVGYTQYVRRAPTLMQAQHFTHRERGGISFDTRYSDDPPRANLLDSLENKKQEDPQ